MSWVCPNCSNSNDDEQTNCFVCGMERPASEVSPSSDKDDCKIVFSDFEAIKESIRRLFRRRTVKTKSYDSSGTGSAKPGKTTGTEDTTADKKKAKKAKLFGSDFAKPWPEHKVKFDSAAIRAKGYVRSEQKCMGGVNGYFFYKEDGSGQFIRIEMLLVQKMAIKV